LQTSVDLLKYVHDLLDSLYNLNMPLKYESGEGPLDIISAGINSAMQT
jgi:hypothetical protein